MKPQAVTSRYINNLMAAGHNREFRLTSIILKTSVVDGVSVGNYYVADVVYHAGGDDQIMVAVGKTPHGAVRNALIKHGVTFR